ncbi:MAG: MBL fold metallo-hydrolase [Candidatus Pacebacteria bacterium]|nr:MBL fold metallo-hydrolase [Candidatus Paceibacterota bacterium]
MKKPLLYLLLLLLSANIFTFWIIFDYFYLGKGEVSFLDVGQGDAELIQTRGGNILIDAGPDMSIVQALNKSLPFFDKTLDLFILSHPNKDHFNGLFELLERYEIRAVMLNNVFYNDSQYQKLLQELAEKDILIIQGVRGVKLSFGGDNLFVIYPQTMVSSGKDPNEFSQVVSLDLGENYFLFLGDISASQEKEILPSLPENNKLRILKVAHHGSRYSSSWEFLEKFRPQFAIIEVGSNNYGHPHPDTLNRLSQIGAKIFRTDLDGTIRFKEKMNKPIQQ